MTDLVALRKELGELMARLQVVGREMNDDACATLTGRVDVAYKGRAAMAIDALVTSIITARIQIRVAYELPDEEG